MGVSGHTTGIMLRLKTETMQLHKETEDSAFQRDLLKGTLPIERYADLLEQLQLIHHTLEETLREQAAVSPPIGHVVREEQFQEPHIDEDLRFFRRDPHAAMPKPSTARFMDAILDTARTVPIGLLGIHYVFEGSKNGGRFIARRLESAYGLKVDSGLRSLDPYGERQPERWREFKAAMEALPLSAGEQDTIVDAAKQTFGAIMAIHREAYAGPHPVPQGTGSSGSIAPQR
jgi:heme oxygenase